MATPDAIARLNALLDRQEALVRDAFQAYVDDVTNEATMAEIEAMLGRGDIEGVLRIVDSYITRMGGVVPVLYMEAGRAHADEVAPQLRGISPTAAVGFDPINSRAARLVQTATFEFIREFSDAQRQAVRSALTQAMMRGQNPTGAARAFREAIGLTEHQLSAVQNYRDLLQANSADALDRALRDSRFDRTVERAVSTNQPLTPQQIDRMVGRYHERMLAARADAIARTESTRATSAARHEQMTQTAEAAGISDDRIVRTWRAIHDSRTRLTHELLDGQSVVGMNTPFRSASGALLLYPGDPAAPAEEVVNCRCAVTYRILAPGEMLEAA